MRRAERIFGILTIAVFIAGLIFKYRLMTGGGIMVVISLPLFVFGYLPMHFGMQRHATTTVPQHIYLYLKIITYALAMISSGMIIQHWSGGWVLMYVSISLAAVMTILYLYLRFKGMRRLSTSFNDLVTGLLLIGIFFYLSNPRASYKVLEGHQLILDQYEKQNAGIESSLRIVYQSVDSLNLERDPALKIAIQEVKYKSEKLHMVHDSLKRKFIGYCNVSLTNNQDVSTSMLHPVVLASGLYGSEFFIDYQNGLRLKQAIEAYTGEIDYILKEFNLSSGLIGLGLEVDDIEDTYGNRRPWEIVMFYDQRVSSVMNNLLWIRQMALRTESAVVNGLLTQADLSQEMKFIQELAAQESGRAMDQKENELIRIRQQQELQTLQLEQSTTEIRQRNITIISAFTGIGFVLILLVITTRAFYRKRRDNKSLARQQKEITNMNQALNERNEEIMAQRDEIEAKRDMVLKQKDVIEKSHGEMSASIDYAKRLQTSILPSPGLLRTRISDHFVVFMPKHRVSGDFYWWTQIEDHVVVAAADCTGHGVPGAFMSMLGVSMLREIVSKEYISHPGVILRRLRKEVMYALKQTGEFGEQKDGMDMSLVSINVETLECQYAGANNPLYLVRDGELTEYKADRMPIAIHQNMAKFKTHDIQLQKGDHLYLFSDGFVDQFGGPEGKKFKFVKFRQMLVDNATLPMKKQKEVVENTFASWKGDQEQVDDIVVLALEI